MQLLCNSIAGRQNITINEARLHKLKFLKLKRYSFRLSQLEFNDPFNIREDEARN